VFDLLRKIGEMPSDVYTKMDLRLPSRGAFDEGKKLGLHERVLVGKQLAKVQPTAVYVNEMFVATEKQFAETERIENLRKQIVDDYSGVVFRDKLPPNPGPRGRYGVAYIPLKENAQPTWQKPFAMHGEKEEAYKKIVDGWLEEDLIERPRKMGIEWCSAAFPVPKKSDTFPWRGVVDVRGPNSQTRKCNYPLPLIEEVLVKQGGCHIFSKLDLKQAFFSSPCMRTADPSLARTHLMEYFNGK
jgi:hypothetical protein